MSIYITNKIYMYIANINLTKFEPLKPAHSGDKPFSILIFNEAVEQPYCLAKNTIFILKILILRVCILT